MKEQKNLGVEKIAHSLKEASSRLGVSVGHLRNEHRRGKLRFVKSGRRTLITDAELRRYLAESESETEQVGCNQNS
jgi:excisionase family DNA binding protein